MKIAMQGTAVKRSGEMSAEEATVRRDLAACYRLVAMNNWDDLLATHISARVPGEEGAFLINPIGLLFEEITASSLIKVNQHGEVLQDTPYAVNRAGFVIHTAIYGARPDVGCVMHLHTRDGVAVSAQEDGVLPLNQTAMLVAPLVAFHEYEGVAVNDAEKARLAADLGDKPLMMLRNHGTLGTGGTVAEAFYLMYMLEWACSVQIRTLAAGRPLHAAPADSIHATGELMLHAADASPFVNDLVWPALIRKLDRLDTGYKD